MSVRAIWNVGATYNTVASFAVHSSAFTSSMTALILVLPHRRPATTTLNLVGSANTLRCHPNMSNLSWPKSFPLDHSMAGHITDHNRNAALTEAGDCLILGTPPMNVLKNRQ